MITPGVVVAVLVSILPLEGWFFQLGGGLGRQILGKDLFGLYFVGVYGRVPVQDLYFMVWVFVVVLCTFDLSVLSGHAERS